MPNSDYYVAPTLPHRAFNVVVSLLSRGGISIMGSRILEVRGRKTDNPQRVPVNLLSLDGSDYLVAPRGQTQWVRNLRVAAHGELLLGRTRTPFTASEVADAYKEPVLRAYLRRWGFQVAPFFDDVKHDSPAADLQRIAAKHPVFKLSLQPS